MSVAISHAHEGSRHLSREVAMVVAGDVVNDIDEGTEGSDKVNVVNSGRRKQGSGR